jgi:hypothetical protein
VRPQSIALSVRILLLAAGWGPSVLFCMSNTTKCASYWFQQCTSQVRYMERVASHNRAPRANNCQESFASCQQTNRAFPRTPHLGPCSASRPWVVFRTARAMMRAVECGLLGSVRFMLGLGL